MVVDVFAASKNSGTNIQLHVFNNSNEQKYRIRKSGDYYKIEALCSGKYVDVAGGSTKSGANVQQHNGNNTSVQKVTGIVWVT